MKQPLFRKKQNVELWLLQLISKVSLLHLAYQRVPEQSHSTQEQLQLTIVDFFVP